MKKSLISVMSAAFMIAAVGSVRATSQIHVLLYTNAYGKPPLPNTAIAVYDVAGVVLGQGTTDSNGKFLFITDPKVQLLKVRFPALGKSGSASENLVDYQADPVNHN